MTAASIRSSVGRPDVFTAVESLQRDELMDALADLAVQALEVSARQG